MGVMAGGIAGMVTGGEARLATVVVAVALTTLITGVFLFGLGTFRLAGLVRFLPYPVAGGFLTGTGWLLAVGGIGTMARRPFAFTDLPALFAGDTLIYWLPGWILGAAILILSTRIRHYLFMPGMIIAIAAGFYLIAALAGMSPAELSAKGWLLGPFPQGRMWQPFGMAELLPFIKGAWHRASEWLQAHESEYWARTGANAYQADADLDIAIEKLIEHGRPHAAINCLDRMRHAKQPINTNQCVRALLAALSSGEPGCAMDGYHIVELIKFLQAEPTVNQDDLFRVEWAYVPLLDRHRGAAPKLLESRLANDPEFFCEIIRLIYRSKKEDKPSRESTEESKAIATNAWRLLHEWKTPPGTQQDGKFSEERFTEWLQRP